MSTPLPRLGRLLGLLDQAPPYALAEVLLSELEHAVGASSCTVLLADYEERSLQPVPGEGLSSSTGSQRVDGSLAGDAYRNQQVEVTDEGRGLLIPITVREERLGVLDVRLSSEVDTAGRAYLEEVGAMLGYVIMAARRYTDRFERIRRRRDLALAAEIQWELLPVLAFADEHFALAGALEPAYEIGGDTFDYAVEPRALTVGISDARGHGVRGALLGALAVTAMRNSRRCGDGLIEQFDTASEVLDAQFGDEDFVTAALLRIDVPAGTGAIVNAGHLPPLRLRAGRCERIEATPQPPLGLFPETIYTPGRVDLQDGDRLMLYSDGITEAAPDHGSGFGEERLRDLLFDTASAAPAEAVRTITTEVLSHRAGQLKDDATVVILDWRGPSV